MSSEAEIKSINDDIIRRFAIIESRLKDCSGITAFFETLLEGAEQQFKIPFVWLSLINEEKNNSLIAKIKASPKLRERLNLVERNLWENLVVQSAKPLLVNSNLKPYFKLFPDGKKYFIKSMALVPLQINGDIIGCWVNADARQERYQPAMHTDILQNFAEFVSRRLSEFS
ncbi:MAG TPA: DUF484 family protein [Smithellaceae bacterium]|nr:DUF484 family protein [Smithellaceae bacterium]HRS90164.1 DUF484 family protein [Smithellaceae bacterium]HRV27024.1 DUF484 family protein [Smithellaceae bacterium]